MNFESGGQAQPGVSMPFSLEAEQSVLGAILLQSECLPTVVDVLPRPDYFYGVNNRQIYGAILEMFAMDEDVDVFTVLDHLRDNPDFDETSDRTYLLQLAAQVPALSHVESYAKIVRDRYERRTLMQAARTILEDASSGEMETALLLDSAEQRIFDIRRSKSQEGLQPVRRGAAGHL